MHPRNFLKELAESADRERLVTAVYDEMLQYCEANNITETELPSDELESLAEGFVTRGLSYEGIGTGGRWRVAETDISDEQPSDEAIKEAFERISQRREDRDYEDIEYERFFKGDDE